MVLMRERGRIHRNVVITCQIRTGKAREIASWPVQRHSSSAYTPNGPLSSSARSAATATATATSNQTRKSKHTLQMPISYNFYYFWQLCQLPPGDSYNAETIYNDC